MIKRLILLILCAFNTNRDQKCQINSRLHFREPLPVIIRNNELLEPTDEFGNVDFNYGDEITLSCENTGGLNHPHATRILDVATVRCEVGDTFKNEDWLSAPGAFSQFQCSQPPDYRSRRTDRTCYDNNPVIEVGYAVQGQFYPVYESCFNEGALNPIYSKYTQKPYNAMYQTRVERPYFKDDNNYRDLDGYFINKLFSPPGQKTAVAKIIGFDQTDNYFTTKQLLSRGHLAAKTDFVFAFGERATFHYVNCAPQWTGFNGGNWNTLEVDLRNHVHNARYDTIIYTGTLGVSTLSNKQGIREELHLYRDFNNNPVIPVPQFYYKVVYEIKTKCGVAFVGINNPYYDNSGARSMFFCEDVCRGNRNFSWLTWHPDNPSEGYTFCCTVPDFRRTVPHIPHFEVNCLLT